MAIMLCTWDVYCTFSSCCCCRCRNTFPFPPSACVRNVSTSILATESSVRGDEILTLYSHRIIKHPCLFSVVCNADHLRRIRRHPLLPSPRASPRSSVVVRFCRSPSSSVAWVLEHKNTPIRRRIRHTAEDDEGIGMATIQGIMNSC
jgi:hypothetical protein